jgi:hypothetical protein
MAIRRSQIAITLLGVFVFAIGYTTFRFFSYPLLPGTGIGGATRIGDLNPMTDSDYFWLHFPSIPLLFLGALLWFVAFVRMLAAIQKSD